MSDVKRLRCTLHRSQRDENASLNHLHGHIMSSYHFSQWLFMKYNCMTIGEHVFINNLSLLCSVCMVFIVYLIHQRKQYLHNPLQPYELICECIHVCNSI